MLSLLPTPRIAKFTVEVNCLLAVLLGAIEPPEENIEFRLHLIEIQAVPDIN